MSFFDMEKDLGKNFAFLKSRKEHKEASKLSPPCAAHDSPTHARTRVACFTAPTCSRPRGRSGRYGCVARPVLTRGLQLPRPPLACVSSPTLSSHHCTASVFFERRRIRRPCPRRSRSILVSQILAHQPTRAKALTRNKSAQLSVATACNTIMKPPSPLVRGPLPHSPSPAPALSSR